VAYHEVKLFAKAAAAYKRSLGLKGADVRARANLGAVLHQTGDHIQARDAFRQVRLAKIGCDWL
jgi:Flp pilus assembly protein TadD